MLGLRRKWWAKIRPALGQRIVFDRRYDTNRWTEMNGILTDRDSQTALSGYRQSNMPSPL